MKDDKLNQFRKWKDMLLSSLYKWNSAVLKYRNFFNVARFFVHKVRRELEASDGNVESVVKRRKHKLRSDTVRTSQFVQQVQDIIDDDPQSP